MNSIDQCYSVHKESNKGITKIAGLNTHFAMISISSTIDRSLSFVLICDDMLAEISLAVFWLLQFGMFSSVELGIGERISWFWLLLLSCQFWWHTSAPSDGAAKIENKQSNQHVQWRFFWKSFGIPIIIIYDSFSILKFKPFENIIIIIWQEYFRWIEKCEFYWYFFSRNWGEKIL